MSAGQGSGRGFRLRSGNSLPERRWDAQLQQDDAQQGDKPAESGGGDPCNIRSERWRHGIRVASKRKGNNRYGRPPVDNELYPQTRCSTKLLLAVITG